MEYGFIPATSPPSHSRSIRLSQRKGTAKALSNSHIEFRFRDVQLTTYYVIWWTKIDEKITIQMACHCISYWSSWRTKKRSNHKTVAKKNTVLSRTRYIARLRSSTMARCTMHWEEAQTAQQSLYRPGLIDLFVEQESKCQVLPRQLTSASPFHADIFHLHPFIPTCGLIRQVRHVSPFLQHLYDRASETASKNMQTTTWLSARWVHVYWSSAENLPSAVHFHPFSRNRCAFKVLGDKSPS